MEPYLTEALSRAEIPEALLLLGVLREREGRFREALHLLERAAFRGEGEVAGMAYHHLAQVKRALRRPLKEVLGDHKRAHALRAYPAPYLFRLAQEALEGEEVLARGSSPGRGTRGWRRWPRRTSRASSTSWSGWRGRGPPSASSTRP